MTNDQLIEKATRLFHAQYGLVLGAARRYAPVAADVDDVVQQVYLDFLQGVLEQKWDLERDVGVLLYQIAKRKSQILWRKISQENRHAKYIVANHLIENAVQHDSELEEIEYDKIRLQALEHCVEQLPPKTRSVIQRYYFEEISIKEIADDIQQKETTVYSIIFRTRFKLRECIERFMKTNNEK